MFELSHENTLESKKIRILIVSERTCIRTIKQVIALSKNHEVHLITKRQVAGDWLKTVTLYDGTEKRLRDALKLYDFVDIVYAAAEPSWLVFVIREVLKKKKLVLDIHDAMIWRTTELEYSSAEERLAFDWVDGVVVPSLSCKTELVKRHPVRCPIVVLPPYVNECFYYSRQWQRVGGIVYQGRIDLPGAKDFMNYCKYEELNELLYKEDIPFTIYMPGEEAQLKKWRAIYEPKATFLKGLPYEEMVAAMGFYDWGLCGNIKEFREWDLAMPNKLFDYLAGGIPVIALNAELVGRFVEEQGVGISVKSIQEIKDRWDERAQCQKNVFLKRYEFSMEQHIYVVENLLERLV